MVVVQIGAACRRPELLRYRWFSFVLAMRGNAARHAFAAIAFQP
jgi:hypothetical protein